MNSATTVPGFSTQQWYQVAKNTDAIPVTDPRYPRAQAAHAMARQAIMQRTAAAGHMMPGVAQSMNISLGGDPAPTRETNLTPDEVQTFLTHFGNQAALGFSDELGAAPAWLGIGVKQGETHRQAYERALAEQRDYLAAGQDANPKSAFAGDVTGTAAGQGVLQTAALRAIPGAANVLRAGMAKGAAPAVRAAGALTSGTLGAGGGILQGLGNADGGDLATRALLGGVVGLGAGLVPYALASGFQWLRGGFQKAADAVRGGTSSVGGPVADAGTATGPEAVVRATLAQAGKSPAQIDEAVAALQQRYGSLNRPGIAATPVQRPQQLPAGFIRNQGTAEMGLGGQPSVPATQATAAPAQGVHEAPAGAQSAGGHYFDYGAQKWVPQPESGPEVLRVDASGNRHLASGVVEAPVAPERMPGSGSVLRGAAAAQASHDAEMYGASGVLKHLTALPLTAERASQAAPILQSFPRAQARSLMAEVARTDALGRISPDWRDFLLTHLGKAGSGR